MSDMKCPVCGHWSVTEFDTPPYYVCDNEYCPSYEETDTKTYDVLIRTRKALDCAIKHLEGIRGCDKNRKPMTGVISCWIDCDELAKALEQIESITKGAEK